MLLDQEAALISLNSLMIFLSLMGVKVCPMIDMQCQTKNRENAAAASGASLRPLALPHRCCLVFSVSGWVPPPASEAATPSIRPWAAELDPTGPPRCGSSGSFTSSAVGRRTPNASPRWDSRDGARGAGLWLLCVCHINFTRLCLLLHHNWKSL